MDSSERFMRVLLGDERYEEYETQRELRMRAATIAEIHADAVIEGMEQLLRQERRDEHKQRTHTKRRRRRSDSGWSRPWCRRGKWHR